MLSKDHSRREFITAATAAGIGWSLTNMLPAAFAGGRLQPGGRAGIIGLDTSHSIEIIKALNQEGRQPELEGYRVVAAYPKGSSDIKSSVDRIPAYTQEAVKNGVEIVPSIEDLLKKVDVVFLETNDGKPRLEQAMKVIRAGKPMFIDKPVAASLQDVGAIYAAAKERKVPVFSSSSLRYLPDALPAREGKLVGKVLGADTYSPAALEKTHPDLFWYGIHGVEILFAVMGPGCEWVHRVHSEDTDIVTGTWKDGRIGVFRGTRSGKHIYGGRVFGEQGVKMLGEFKGTYPLIVEIINFFKTGVAPVDTAETMEIYAFMAAADASKKNGGTAVSIRETLRKANIQL